MKDILISHLGPQGLWRWLKSCQPRVSVGAMQFSIWDYSFSVNAFPCHWYLIFHSFSSSDLPSVLTDVAVRAYGDVHPLPPRSIWWSSEVDSLPELRKKMNRSPPTAKSQVHKQAPVQRCSHGLNRAYSHKLESQLQSCSCLSLVTHFNFTLVNVKIICYFKKKKEPFIAQVVCRILSLLLCCEIFSVFPTSLATSSNVIMTTFAVHVCWHLFCTWLLGQLENTLLSLHLSINISVTQSLSQSNTRSLAWWLLHYK